MYCKHCGKEIADDSLFCQHCGGRQSVSTTNNSTDANTDTQRKEKVVEIPTIMGAMGSGTIAPYCIANDLFTNACKT